MQVFVSSTNVGSAAEPDGSQYLVQDPIAPTFPLLSTLKDMPIQIFAGSEDTTAPQETLDKRRRPSSSTAAVGACH